MNAKAYLRSIRDGMVEMRMHKENIDRLRTSIGVQSPRYAPAKVQTLPPSDRIAQVAAQIDELENLLMTISERTITRHRMASYVISRMTSAPQRRLLIAYYLSLNDQNKPKTWREVCEELDYTYTHAKRVHKEALESYDRMNTLINAENKGKA